MSTDHEWLNLIEVSGPFLALPVLRDIFPQGLQGLDGIQTQRLRRAYEEWRDAVDSDDVARDELHVAWINEVLGTGLQMDVEVLRRGSVMPDALRTKLPEYGITLVPDIALVDVTHDEAPLLLIQILEPDADLDATRRFEGLAATPSERMVMLLRAVGCPLGLVTNGERWMLVHAPVGSVTTFASWYARLWGQEPETLRAFVSLLGLGRFFEQESKKLPTLFELSLKHQNEVTDALGEQVRRAVEVLVQAVDRADQDRNRDLLHDVEPRELYEAGLTVMMRLVFLLAAEERGLLLLGDPRYDANYALSTLRMQLRAETEEILERRRSAWSRLLALFRAVYGGIDHPTLSLPALGGSLFDPDRFPFLEGRIKGTSWRTHPAAPLPIDDRTVLLLIEAFQTFEGRTLSYRALDVEQLGYVYEGLLERTVKRVSDVTLELEGSAKAKDPRVTLGELESARLEGHSHLIELVRARSERSEAAIHNILDRNPDERLAAKLLTACRGDVALRDRVLPYMHLFRTDPWGYPLLHHSGAFVVVLGSTRRETGTHYTPKSLTEQIVEETLIPVVYVGPAEGKPRDEWVLKRPSKLLDLKLCDPAMGSGAFLVQVCRWLGERLVEAWAREEAEGRPIDTEGHVRLPDETEPFESMPSDAEERAISARRLIAERCLYGVDLNPLAVELAKLSLWLITLAKGRPFGFLDHNLKSGDSLLGIHRIEQLSELALEPSGERHLRFYGQSIRLALNSALELRQRLRETPIRDIRDVETMAALDTQARSELELPERIADALIGAAFATSGQSDLENRLISLAEKSDRIVQGNRDVFLELTRQAQRDLAKDAPDGRPRRPFHWPLEFPEVFLRKNGGFDAMVGTPPFLGGKRISGMAGNAYRDWLVSTIAQGRHGSADLVAYFFLRAYSILREGGGFGLLAVNTIAEGDTRQVGLEPMVYAGAVIHAAYPNEPWPGSAAVVTSRVHVRKGLWKGQCNLLGRTASFISPFLSDREEWSLKPLKTNNRIAFIGSFVLGMGFVLPPSEAQQMLNTDARNADVLFPYLNGEDLNSDPEQRPSRWVINFWDWPEERAMTYTLPYRWVEERVKPERQRLNSKCEFALRKPLPERWWQYADKRPALYHSIGLGDHFERHPENWKQDTETATRVIAITRVSKTLAFTFADSRTVFSDATVVFILNRYRHFSLLQSSIHAVFAWQYASRLKSDLRYSPTDALEPFPFPIETNGSGQTLDKLGSRLHDMRHVVMNSDRIGLTKLYSRFHSPAAQETRIEELRLLQREVDIAVASAYGWNDLDLDHGFHEVPYLPETCRVRFTISESARLEVLHRLSELNRQRYEGEVAQGLHGTHTPAKTTRTRQTGTKGASQHRLDLSDTPTTSGPRNSVSIAAPSHSTVLDFLRAHNGWHAKSDILAATGLADSQWNAAITDLIQQGLVGRQGEKRGTRYRAIAQTGASQ